MKKLTIWLMAAALLGGTSAQAQQQRTCGTMAHEQMLQQQNPDYTAKRQFVEQQVQEYLQSNPVSKQANSVITIPVVVHVVYQTASQNISDAQVLSQIAVLNEDFRKMNTDAGSVPGMFSGVAADTEIEFCMAQRDPNGAPTTGITRTQTNVSEWTSDAVKFTSQGGKDAWNTNKYLNMWVCNLGGGLLGYAQFPASGPASTDGLVMGYNYFGRVGNVTAPYHKGRTATHEIGHWLNLFHIWGDANCGNDQVTDTPTQQQPNYGCPNFPHASCGNTSDMFMNYMDYVDDACMNMFTLGQKARMVATLNTTRASLLTSDGCVPPGASAVDAGIATVVAPGPQTCTLTFSPVVSLRNYGSSALTTVTIGFNVDNNMPATFTWTGNLASQASVNVVLPQVTVTQGNHTFTVTTTNPNNTTDSNAGNDSKTVSFVANNYTAALALPQSEGFEGAFTPTGWQIENPDNDLTWEATTLAAKTGTKSVRVNNYSYNAAGQADFLIMPAVDLTSMLSPTLSFDLAYKLYTSPTANPNFSDTLQVWVTTDCGDTWQVIYKKFGATLSTGTGPVNIAADYVPAPGDWRKESINLNSIANSNYAVFAFRNTTGYENNLYIDDVNISGISASDDDTKLDDNLVQLFPNPTTGFFDLSVSGQPEGDLEVTVFDQLGRQVQVAQQLVGQHSMRIDLRNQPNGLYIAQVKVDNSVAMRKVILSR